MAFRTCSTTRLNSLAGTTDPGRGGPADHLQCSDHQGRWNRPYDARRENTGGLAASGIRLFVICLVMFAIGSSRTLFAAEAIGPSANTRVVVLLADGSRITADRVERNESAGELTATIERAGATISRTLKFTEVRSVRPADVPGSNTGHDSIANTPAQHDISARAIDHETAQPSASTGFFSDDALRAVQFHQPSDECCRPQSYPGRIIGVRNDPLSGYSQSVSRAFPDGVPLSEVEFAVELMRAERARDVLTPVLPPASDNQSTTPPGSNGGDAVPRPRNELPAAPPPQPQANRGRVDGVLVEVRPISSQGRSDWDSLLLDVQAVDSLGRVVPVSGTIQATLWGRKQRLVRTNGDNVMEELGDVTKLAEWTRNLQTTTGTVRAKDGQATSAAQFVVPLSRPLPEHDLKLAAFGDLHMRLSVPGEGVFEATQSGVPLRKMSLVRGRNVIERGSVMLPGEFTTDSPSARGSLLFERPTSGPDRGVLSIEP